MSTVVETTKDIGIVTRFDTPAIVIVAVTGIIIPAEKVDVIPAFPPLFMISFM